MMGALQDKGEPVDECLNIEGSKVWSTLLEDAHLFVDVLEDILVQSTAGAGHQLECVGHPSLVGPTVVKLSLYF
jgi:hypothetical protein